jgi:predicted RNA-binding Zn-ribbon protein involved in translation (DUF1610 family)
MKYRLVLHVIDDDGDEQESVWMQAESWDAHDCPTCGLQAVDEAEDVWIGDVAATICGSCYAERHIGPTVQAVICPHCTRVVSCAKAEDHWGSGCEE